MGETRFEKIAGAVARELLRVARELLRVARELLRVVCARLHVLTPWMVDFPYCCKKSVHFLISDLVAVNSRPRRPHYNMRQQCQYTCAAFTIAHTTVATRTRVTNRHFAEHRRPKKRSMWKATRTKLRNCGAAPVHSMRLGGGGGPGSDGG